MNTTYPKPDVERPARTRTERHHRLATAARQRQLELRRIRDAAILLHQAPHMVTVLHETIALLDLLIAELRPGAG